MDYIREGRLVASLESVQTLRQLSVGCQAGTSNWLLVLPGFLSSILTGTEEVKFYNPFNYFFRLVFLASFCFAFLFKFVIFELMW